jgi:hypothetical protein
MTMAEQAVRRCQRLSGNRPGRGNAAAPSGLLRQWFTRSEVIRRTCSGTGRGCQRRRVCRLIAEVRIGRLCRDTAQEFRLCARVNGLFEIEGIGEKFWFRKISAVHPKPGRLTLGSKPDRDRNVRVSGDSSRR